MRLDVFHFMRRFTNGLTTEHHPLYGTFCSKLSNCIFEWDKQDVNRLKEAKRGELKQKHQGHDPTDAQVLASISSRELAKHCRRRTRGVEETRALIQSLLDSMWELVDGTGLHLIHHERMSRVWKVQQKHLPCIQDPPGVHLYTNIGSGLEKGGKTLDVLRCSRGSSSLESFHRHQCAFIPGMLKPLTHFCYTFDYLMCYLKVAIILGFVVIGLLVFCLIRVEMQCVAHADVYARGTVKVEFEPVSTSTLYDRNLKNEVVRHQADVQC